MAHIVVVEPGDVLVIGSQVGFDEAALAPVMERLKALTGVPLVVVMEGPADLAVVRKSLDEGGPDAVAGA